jgi:hypothetical protein
MGMEMDQAPPSTTSVLRAHVTAANAAVADLELQTHHPFAADDITEQERSAARRDDVTQLSGPTSGCAGPEYENVISSPAAMALRARTTSTSLTVSLRYSATGASEWL